MDESPYPISVSNAAPSIANSLLTGDQLNMGTAGVLSTFTVEVGRKSLLVRLFTSFFFFFMPGFRHLQQHLHGQSGSWLRVYSSQRCELGLRNCFASVVRVGHSLPVLSVLVHGHPCDDIHDHGHVIYRQLAKRRLLACLNRDQPQQRRPFQGRDPVTVQFHDVLGRQVAFL